MDSNTALNMQNRSRGALLGLAVGDAVGTTLEFKPPGSFTPITDMVGGGPFNLKPGQWTDDTSMALCLAHSLLHHKGFDANDQMNRYCNWWQYGYMSSTGDCFDIGNTVVHALNRYLETGEPMAGSIDPYSAGNGSLMRLAPVPLFYANNIEHVIHYAGESSRTTHGAEECIDACRYFAVLIHHALQGNSKDAILGCRIYQPTSEKVEAISATDYSQVTGDDIRGTGYVIDALEAAIWCFATTDSFDAAILKAANLGDDADTTAAITGQLAGAYYAEDGINTEWLNRLHQADEIRNLADKLIAD